MPWIGDVPIAELSNQPLEILKTLERIQQLGAVETPRRAQQLSCNGAVCQSCRYGMGRG